MVCLDKQKIDHQILCISRYYNDFDVIFLDEIYNKEKNTFNFCCFHSMFENNFRLLLKKKSIKHYKSLFEMIIKRFLQFNQSDISKEFLYKKDYKILNKFRSRAVDELTNSIEQNNATDENAEDYGENYYEEETKIVDLKFEKENTKMTRSASLEDVVIRELIDSLQNESVSIHDRMTSTLDVLKELLCFREFKNLKENQSK